MARQGDITLNFIAAVILVALIAPFVLVGRAVGLWRRGSRWAAGLLISAAGSILVYAAGLLFVGSADFAKSCGHEAVRPPRNADWFEEGSFPLTATCHWDGGRTYSLVPAFVNPLIYACIAFTLLCAVMAIREHHRNGHTS
ncbi:hypothetical protein OG242_20800 [Streptomyces sp. NBC_00727]|uniref:hypothetical protein n=1 Tax=Streptomyces sp. NBC_00727 TaxID=2903675 RepID=UPI00386AE42E